MQTVSKWKKGIQGGKSGSVGLQSVSDWKKTRPIIPTPIMQPQKPTLLAQAEDFAKKYAKESAGTVIPFGEAILHPIKTLKKLPSVFTKPFMAGIKKASTPLEKGNIITDTANLISGIAESLFSPITGAFTIAENIPGAKQVADVLALPFQATGLAGSFATGKIVDVLPISQETKDIIKQPLQEVGALAGQVLLGGRIMEKIGKTAKVEEITPKVAKKIVEEAKTEVKQQRPELFKEPARAETKPLSVAEWQAKGKPKAPVEPEIAPKVSKPVKPREKSIEGIKYEPLIKESGLSRSVKTKAIKDKMIYAFDRKFRELPEYEKRIKTEDIKKATELTLNNPNEALKIAMGEKRPPAGMLPEDIFVAVNEYATQTKNVEILRKLANESKLLGEATVMGQRIQALSQLSPDAISTKLAQIKKARESRIKNFDNKKSDIVNNLKNETGKTHLTKEELSWNKFLNEITC